MLSVQDESDDNVKLADDVMRELHSAQNSPDILD